MIDPTPVTPDPHSSEPLVSVGAVVAAVTAVLDLVVLFGVHLSDAQTSGILAVVNIVAPIAVALWGRRKVYSPASVSRLIAAARR